MLPSTDPVSTCADCERGSSTSYAIKKKDELERVARSNR